MQVQGGTSAVTAFIQQGSQMLGVLGPIGAVAGAALAVFGSLAGAWLRSGEEAESAADRLKKLTEGTDEYRASVERLLPLTKANLENEIALAKAREEAEQRRYSSPEARAARVQTNAALNPFAIGGIPAPVDNPFGPGPQQRLVPAPRWGFQNPTTEGQAAIERAARAQLEIRLAPLTSAVGKFEAKPGEASRDYVIEGNRKAEEAARQVKARTEQGQRLLQQLTLEADASKRLADATELGTAAVKEAQIANEEERKLLEASRSLKGEQLKQAEELIHSTAERERRQLALNEATKAELALAQERIDRTPASMGGFYDTKYSGRSVSNPAVDTPYKDPEAERYADLQRDILVQPFKDAASEINGVMRGVFDDILEDGTASFGDLADAASNLFKTTISSTASSLITLPINTAISEVARQSMQPGQTLGGTLQQFGQQHPYLASAGLGATGGYITGSLYGQLTGKQDTYASTGGALGGAAGATLGMFLGGPAGAAAGGILGSIGGSFLGGLFGGKMGNDASNQDYWTGKKGFSWSDSSFSPENRSITSGIGGQLTVLQESLGDLGAVFKNVGISIGAGNKSGIQVNGKQYGSQEEALQAALRLVLNSAGGLQGSQRTALANTKGRNVQEVLSDVQFAKEFDKITFKGTAADAAMRDLNERFDELGRKAKELKLNEQALAEARAKAVEQLQTEKARQDRDLGAQYLSAVSQSPLEQLMLGVDQTFAHLSDTLKDAGYSSERLAEVEAARVRAQDEVVRQYQQQAVATQRQLEQQVRGVGSFYDGLIDPLKAVANDNAALNPSARIAAARRQYETDLAGAQGGDLQATQRLSSSGQGLLGLSTQYYGTGGQGAEIARQVRSGLLSVAGSLERQKLDTLATLPQVQRETVASQTEALLGDARQTRDVLERILRELGNLRRVA